MTGPTPQTPYESRDTFRTPDPADLSQSRPTGWSAWDYREDSGVTGAALAGYRVEATDGHIGKVDSASTEVAPVTWSSTPGRGSSVRRSCCRPASSTTWTTTTTRSTWTARRSRSSPLRSSTRNGTATRSTATRSVATTATRTPRRVRSHRRAPDGGPRSANGRWSCSSTGRYSSAGGDDAQLPVLGHLQLP